MPVRYELIRCKQRLETLIFFKLEFKIKMMLNIYLINRGFIFCFLFISITHQVFNSFNQFQFASFLLSFAFFFFFFWLLVVLMLSFRLYYCLSAVSGIASAGKGEVVTK